jgi:hypothetical protein
MTPECRAEMDLESFFLLPEQSPQTQLEQLLNLSVDSELLKNESPTLKRVLFKHLRRQSKQKTPTQPTGPIILETFPE